jgi:hypothetical protein
MQAELKIRTEHYQELFAANGFTIANAPRASHHIFTNLPNPGGVMAEMVGSTLEKRGCDERYRRLAHRLKNATASEQLEHVVAQLLFDPRYTRSVGSCRELTIHWDAPADVCDQLANYPEKTLSAFRAHGDVQSVIDRYRITTKLQKVAETLSGAEGMSSLGGLLDNVTPQRFVSFHCYISEDRPDVYTATHELELSGQNFQAQEMRVARAVEDASIDDRYHHVAAMLIPSFHYGHLLSGASTSELLESGVDPKFFTGQTGFLSRLDYLSDVDIFLANPWIETREDLLEIYPYHLHLHNYVALFRARYRAERGRL